MSAPTALAAPGSAPVHATNPGPWAAGHRTPYARWSVVTAVFFLVFLAFPLIAAVQAPDGQLARGLTVLAIVSFAAVYLWAYREQHAWLLLAVLIALTLTTVPVLGLGALGLAPYVSVHCALHLPRPHHLRVAVPVVLLPFLLAAFPGWQEALFFALITVPVGGGMLAVREMIDQGTQFEKVETALALSTERDRVARDVHDVLGHSLTAILLKADLAERLVGRDDEAARREIHEVATLARHAVAEVRSTVVDLRTPDLAEELDRARRLVEGSGSRFTMTGSPDDLPRRHAPAVAWVLREAVTNAVRHAGAEHVAVSLAPTHLVVRDDGCGVQEPMEGHGSRGIRERAADIGGAARWEDAGPGTRFVLTLPPDGMLR